METQTSFIPSLNTCPCREKSFIGLGRVHRAHLHAHKHSLKKKEECVCVGEGEGVWKKKVQET